ncbi:MAG TPA: CoA transferase [Streptosporangiaceae bacterium]|jgi:crotonobetainyl-CoA:carnitine CoA-transferase CaiB-like acyl-CoA transferase
MMPLEGLRVIDASTIIAGPLCCQILGDYGADVIKVEHPVAGDSMRGHGRQKDGVPLWWKEISRNKQTIGLDLGKPDGAEVFRRLAATADVVVENFRPGTLERWGLAPARLHELNEGLVLVRLTGFGQTGPYAARPGFGTLAEAMSGFAHLTGPADGPPTLPAFGLADTICGIAASSAAMMALWHRDMHSGPGQVIDISILEPIMTAVGPGPTIYDQLGVVEERHGNRSTNNAPRNTYQTADGAWVAVSTSAQRIAERVLRLVGHPEVIAEPWFGSGRGRAQHADLLDRLVGDWIAQRERDTVLAAFTEAGAAVAPVYSARDIVADPHIRATEMITEVQDDELGPMLMHNVLWRMSRTPGQIRHTGRALGADTDAVLGALGYDDTELARLRAAQAIR